MTLNNKTIIEKADVTLATLASGGLMNPEQADTFLRMVQSAPTILKDSRFVQMASDTRKIEKMGFGNRILRPGVEGKVLADADRSAPSTSTVTLNAKEVIAEVHITYDTLENNIEGDNLQNTIMQMIAERAALDIEELIVNGDKTSTDPYLALFDGLRKQATSHVVDHAAGAFTKDVFKKAYKAVPAKYLRNPKDWKFYTSHGLEVEWKDQVAGRQTNLGDFSLQGGLASAYGVPVGGIAMLQPYTDSTKTVSDILLTHPKNIVTGMSRNIRIEVDKDIRARKFIIVLTAKVDAKFEEEDAVAKVIKVAE
ncbi:phage major capsid protein [Bacillus cereus]|uniref:Major capsid protein n=1 Tax=Bacillus phage 0105phi7-2 TaxID=3025408 RepID=A0AAF0BTI7_9CAUD|nr:phage major capsid protein [Bacillus wiedmannii]YP_010742675.1 major capsid protein [Bacillus phage 0105phi7-2]MCU5414628.1 phage major capsid protein [Bacillus wiedmannii]WCS66552.1 major capsid protein [Bacillus phage 0105phi7-2]